MSGEIMKKMCKAVPANAVLTAVLISCMVILLPAAAPVSSFFGSHQVFAKEQSKAEEKESAENASEDAAEETEQNKSSGQESESDSSPVLDTVLTDEMREEVMSMSFEELEMYAKQIAAVISNPDFQALFEYEDVRELIVMIIKNSLNFAQEDPDLTSEILETMGVDRGAVIVFFALLDAQQNQDGVTENVLNFVSSEQGAELMSIISESIDDEQTAAMADFFSQLIEADQKLEMGGETEQETESEVAKTG